MRLFLVAQSFLLEEDRAQQILALRSSGLRSIFRILIKQSVVDRSLQFDLYTVMYSYCFYIRSLRIYILVLNDAKL